MRLGVTRLQHEPVLLREVISILRLQPGEAVLDGTVGSGGHAEAILAETGPSGILIGIDQDASALERAKKRLEHFGSRVILKHANFRNLDTVLADVKVSAVDAVLLDVGVSLEQLSEAERGFSFRLAGPLDMRMDQSSETTAYDLIRALSETELSEIFFKYGEERRAMQIARWIVAERNVRPIRTTFQLAELIREKMYGKRGGSKMHPATRIFQALRIVTNQELKALEEGVAKTLTKVKPGGRVAVITFHSLEDRIVKQAFLEAKKSGTVELLVKKPVVPTREEMMRNPRSRSAKLRAVRKVLGVMEESSMSHR